MAGLGCHHAVAAAALMASMAAKRVPGLVARHAEVPRPLNSSWARSYRTWIAIAVSHWPGEGTGLHGATTIIHGMPKRSATMPKREEKKVLVNGNRTCPPSAKIGRAHV